MFEQDQSVSEEIRSDDGASAEARRLLREALEIVDAIGPEIAAIHICWAIDLLAEPKTPRPPSIQ